MNVYNDKRLVGLTLSVTVSKGNLLITDDGSLITSILCHFYSISTVMSIRHALCPYVENVLDAFSGSIKAQRQEMRSTTAAFFAASASTFPIAELGIVR